MILRRLLDRIASPALRARFWRMLEEPERRRFQRELKRAAFTARRGEPVVNYGDALAGDDRGILHGGAVKLLHVAKEFPAAATDFNLLYLVSSAPPRFAFDFVRWTKACGARLVWNQNGVAYPAWYGARSEEINGPMRLLRAQADYIFYQSEFCRQCADRFLGPTEVPGEIAFNSVDTGHFRPSSPVDTTVCRLLVAGSHYESYRVISALETVAELLRRKFPVELHLAGRLAWENAEAEVAGAIHELGIEPQVRRIPPYRQDEAPAIYQAAHILLHAKYKDPCPTVPIEAMACGVPVIGSASGGLPELVSPEAGMLIDVPDSWSENHWPSPTAQADAVEKIMRAWPEYRAAARRHVEAKFSKEGWMAQHRRIFAQLAAA